MEKKRQHISLEAGSFGVALATSSESIHIDPATAYQTYLDTLRAGNHSCLLEMMTDERARDLQVMTCSREFGPFFDVWRSLHSEKVDVLSVHIDGDVSTLTSREGKRWMYVQLRLERERWRVHEERYFRHQSTPDSLPSTEAGQRA